ncbi:MAG: MATE family efflux transporter [Lachnospiraceae bacterium]|nr:MATE family efflux transporter [Lachnospiraceae bacterium]
MSAASTVKDLTEGRPAKLILAFSIPVFMGNLFQQFYTIIDTLIVGRVLGEDALAAVGCTSSVNFLVVGFCIGLCSGFSIPVAQKFGAKDYEGMRRCVANCLWVGLFFAAAVTVTVSLNAHNILRLMKTPSNIIDMAYTYILVIFIGIPMTMLYNVVSGLIRALGDSKTPLVFLIISSLLNIGLDIFFMVQLQMGVFGAALATILSQTIAGIACLIYMICRYPLLRVQKGEWGLDRRIVLNLCNMGIPMGLQYSITAIGGVILQSSVNTLGSEVVAAMTTSGKIGMFFACGFDALGATMTTYGGQNLGARRLDRISEGLRDCLIIGFTYAIVSFVILYFWAAKLAGLFVTDPSAELLYNARLFLLANSASYILLAMVNIFRFLIQGLGYSRLAILAGVAEMIARTLAGMILVPLFGVYGAALASPLAWLFADAFLIPAYYYVKKRLAVVLQYENNDTAGIDPQGVN